MYEGDTVGNEGYAADLLDFLVNILQINSFE